MYVGVKPFNTLYTVNMILKNESCRQPVSGYDKGGYMLQQDWDDMKAWVTCSRSEVQKINLSLE